MAQPPNIDGILITWGDRLFYPGNRVVKVKPPPRLSGDAARQRAATIRRRIEATVVRRAPQVMVEVTGGGRGMKAIAAHFRYISKNGRLEIEDQRSETMRGKDTLRALAEEWRFGGSLIRATRAEAVEAWMQVGRALAMTGDAADRDLARSIATFIKEMPATQAPEVPRQAADVTPQPKPIDIGPTR